MTRLSSSVFAALVSFALAVPALAQPLSSGDLPSCGDDKHDKKDEKKDPAVASPQCGDDKHDKKDEKKDPAVASPQCGDDKHDKKDEKKDPARV